jgi:hypothetical protein
MTEYLISSEHLGDPAAGIIPRRPILTDVGGETAKRLLRDRLSYCRRSHRQAPDGDIFPLPTRLLDLGMGPNTRTRLRFTRGESGIYCALSYCWGGERQPTTTKANLIARMAGLETSGLPATIHDAIFVARSLGFRYLWVDALCIVQDDPADKKAEIKAMGSIYYGAALIISASSSSAVSQGFLHPRIEAISIRLPFSLSKDLTGTIVLVANNMERIETEPLQQRGWALQKHVLARRLVIFCTNEVLFRCCHRLEPIQESNIDYTGLDHFLPSTYSLHTSDRMSQYLRRNYWQDIVRNYSVRKFSKPEDRVNALISVATELSKSWDDIYLMGLWRDYFIYHLAWRVWKSADCRTQSNNLPTWTWLSVNASTTITYNMEQLDAQLDQDSGWRGRNAPLYTLDDLDADSGNRAVILRIRTMSASSYSRAAREGIFTHTKIILDYSDSETIPSDATLALLGWYQDKTMWFGILLTRSLEADGTKMERIGYVESSRSTAHRNIWDDIPRITLTLV